MLQVMIKNDETHETKRIAADARIPPGWSQLGGFFKGCSARRPAQLVGAVDKYGATLTVDGRGKLSNLTITIKRHPAVAGEDTARRRPKTLQITLPKRGEHQQMTMALPKATLVEERADGTYGLRVGTHEVKFPKFDQPIDVTITKIGEAAAPAPMEVDE